MFRIDLYDFGIICNGQVEFALFLVGEGPIACGVSIGVTVATALSEGRAAVSL